jgi:hypothetical protein
MNDRSNLASLDDDLRRTLAPVQESAPLPSGVLDVPDDWVRPRGQLVLGVTRSLAVATVVMVGVLVAGQIPSWLGRSATPGTGSMTIEAAALIAGVPPAQVFHAQDGFVAIRLDADGAKLALLLVSEGSQDQLLQLATADIDPQALAPGIVSLDVFHLSCAPGTGLERPDFVFGASRFSNVYPDIELTASSSGVATDGLFAYVVEPNTAPGGVLSVIATSAERHNLSGQTDVPAAAFDHADRCVGESAHAHY